MKNYSSEQVTISIAGIPIFRGYADGAFLRIEPETEAYGDVAGTDGEVTRWQSRDNRATITLILMASSESNAYLSTLFRTDKKTPGGAGVGALLVQDLNGAGTLHASPECWIQNWPTVEYAREPGTYEWPLRVSNLDQFLQGNLGY